MPQQNALAGVLAEVGWVQQVVENVRTGHLIDGHLRISLALSQGDETPVPYVQVDLSEDEERLVLATLDPLSAMAATDAAKLDELLRDVSTGDAALQAMLAELAEQTPFGDTSTDRDGQGIGSTWDQVQPTDNCKVVIGDIETRLSADVVDSLRQLLEDRYEQERRPIFETLEAVIVAGVRAVENSGD